MSSTPSHKLPPVVQTLDDVQQLQAAATRLTTPCGTGALVWHRWGARGGDSAPVLLLHGGSGSWTHWVRNIAALVATGREVWSVDLPGFGDSAPPPDGHDADVMPAWLAQGLEQLLGPTALDLVGFSFGGMVAGLLAAHHPAWVRRLVLVGAPSLTTSPLVQLDLRVWSHVPVGPARDAVLRHNLQQLMLLHRDAATDMVLDLQKDNLRRESRVMKRRNLSRTTLLRETLARVAAPVWGIWGAHDALFRGCEDEIASGLAQAPHFQTLRFIEDAGHWVQFERAEAFNAALMVALSTPPTSLPTAPA